MNDGPSFSWSKSRLWYWGNCKRQYYFNYIGYWNGWLLKAPKRVRQIYFCKNLSPLDTTVGVIVHSVLKDFWTAVANGMDEIDIDYLRMKADKLWKQHVQNTLTKEYRNAKRTPAILEIALGSITDAQLLKANTQIKDCLDNFMSIYNNRMSRIVTVDTVKFIDDFESGFFDTLTTPPLRVYSVVDLAFSSEDELVIVDWKTGNSEQDYSIQLKTYGLWGHFKLKYELDKIHYWTVNLISNTVKTQQFSLEEYAELGDLIESSAKEMDSVQIKSEDFFKMEPGLDKCKRCAFMEVCPQFSFTGKL